MSILTLFVVIPVLMLIGLWLAKNDNQVRGVMVVGASALGFQYGSPSPSFRCVMQATPI